MRTRRPLTALLTVAALLAATHPAAVAGPGAREPAADAAAPSVEPTTAEDWLRLGLSRYESGDFTGAVDAFLAGHVIEPRASFLFAIAQAERRRGDCAAAIRYYDQFLVTSPAPEQEAAAIDQRDRCQQVLDAAAAEPAPDPTPAPAPDPTPTRDADVAAPLPEAPRATRPGFWRDPLTLGLGGAATVATVIGAVLLLSADSAASAATAATTYDQHAALRDRAESRALGGTIALSAGVVLVGAAVFRVLQVSRRRPTTESRRALRLDAGPGAIGVALGGRF